MNDFITPLHDAVKLSANNRGNFPNSYDLKMAKKLAKLLHIMEEKEFTSITFYADMHKDIDPHELRVWVEAHYPDKFRVEEMKNFFTLMVL